MKPFTHAEYEAFRMYHHEFERAEIELELALHGDSETDSDHIADLRNTMMDCEHFLLIKAYRNAVN